jgi:hypothetical protein
MRRPVTAAVVDVVAAIATGIEFPRSLVGRPVLCPPLMETPSTARTE